MTIGFQRSVPQSQAICRKQLECLSVSYSYLDPLDILHLAWICCYSTPAFHVATDWRSWYNNNALSICFGFIPSPLYSQLAISLLHGELLSTDSGCSRNNPNTAIFRFLLHLLHKVSFIGALGWVHYWAKIGLWKGKSSHSPFKEDVRELNLGSRGSVIVLSISRSIGFIHCIP